MQEKHLQIYDFKTKIMHIVQLSELVNEYNNTIKKTVKMKAADLTLIHMAVLMLRIIQKTLS